MEKFMNSINNLLTAGMGWIQIILTALTVILIAYNGIKYMTAHNDGHDQEAASYKRAIIRVVIIAGGITAASYIVPSLLAYFQ